MKAVAMKTADVKTNQASTAPKSKVKPVPAAAAKSIEPVQPVDPRNEADEELDAIVSDYLHAFERMMDRMKIASWKRWVCAYTASFLTGFGIGYVGQILLNLLLVGAAALAVPMFLQFAILVIGWALMFVAAWKLGRKVGVAVLMGDVDRGVANAWGTVRGWFGANERQATGRNELVVA